MRGLCFATAFMLTGVTGAAAPDWIDLSSTPQARERWKEFKGAWLFTADARLDPKEPRQLTGATLERGPVMVVCKAHLTRDLFTKQNYRDLEAHVEFMLSKRSNAGVKAMGLYEIQLTDSHGKTGKLSGDDCGGVYPRGEQLPRYHTFDEGVPPRVNAAKPAGEWQTLEFTFRAPRFVDGKKVENARFLKVTLNGQVVHENVELKYPTGAAWRLSGEVPEGPFMLQCDHGPVAYRNVRIKPINE